MTPVPSPCLRWLLGGLWAVPGTRVPSATPSCAQTSAPTPWRGHLSGLCPLCAGCPVPRKPLWSRPTRRTCQAEAHPTSNAGHTLVSAWSYSWWLVESLGLMSLDQSYRGGSISMDTAPTTGCNAPKAICRCSLLGPITPLTRNSLTC